MTLLERARMVRLFVFEGSDGYVPDRLADCALDDPAAFAVGLLSHVVKSAARCLP